MGADLYLEPGYSQVRKLVQPLFDKACRERDAAAERRNQILNKYSIEAKSLIEATDDIFHPKYKPSGVKQVDDAVRAYERKQNIVAKYYDKLNPSEFYFRDSYNGSSVLWVLGLSWWQDLKTDQKGKNNISVKQCKAFLARIKATKVMSVAELAEYLKDKHVKLDEGKYSPLVWRKYFMAKRLRLIKFLERAIKNGGFCASC